MRNILIRAAFGIILTLLSLLLMRTRWRERLASIGSRAFDRWFFLILAISHFAIFILAFGVLHEKATTDVPGYYVPEAQSVLRGLVPYRDFISSYAPLHSYLDALLLKIHNSPFSIYVFQICCDILAAPFWIGFLRRFMNEGAVRAAACLYLLQPIVLWSIVLDGKNLGLICLLLSISLYAIARKEIVSGVSYSLSLVLVKILPIIFFPIFFFGARKRITWLAAAVIPSLLVYGAFVFYRIDVLMPVKVEGSFVTPRDLPFFISSLTGIALNPLIITLSRIGGLAVAVLFAVAAMLRARTEAARLSSLNAGAILVLLALLVFNSKSDPTYLAMCFFTVTALTVSVHDRGGKLILPMYAALSMVALPIESFWFWMAEPSATDLFHLWTHGSRTGLILMAMQAVLLVAYFGLGYAAVRSLLIAHDQQPAGVPEALTA
jgi:hypothetical protein